MKINNCKELWEGITGEKLETEERAKQLISKSAFKYTQCGCVFGTYPEGIYVAGYAEGSDAELPTYSLNWGFTIEEYWDALGQADAEGVEAWHEANDEDLEGEEDAAN
jgi:hypothetical protein